jgi:hypothetical protein
MNHRDIADWALQHGFERDSMDLVARISDHGVAKGIVRLQCKTRAVRLTVEDLDGKVTRAQSVHYKHLSPPQEDYDFGAPRGLGLISGWAGAVINGLDVPWLRGHEEAIRQAYGLPPTITREPDGDSDTPTFRR